MTFGIRFVPRATVTNKPRSESFLARRREEIWINASFTLVGTLVGFVLGRLG
jgi:hypothetical protein